LSKEIVNTALSMIDQGRKMVHARLIVSTGIVCLLALTCFGEDLKKMVFIETNRPDVEIYIDGTYAGKGRTLDTSLSEGWHIVEGKRQNAFSDMEHVFVGRSDAYNVSLSVRKIRVFFEPRACIYFFPDQTIPSAFPTLGIQFLQKHFIGAEAYVVGSTNSDLAFTGFGLCYSYRYETQHFGLHAGATAGGYNYRIVKTIPVSTDYNEGTIAVRKNTNSSFVEPDIGASIGFERIKLTADVGAIIGSQVIPLLTLGIAMSM
jgi:hypothetical protein